jgi:hypothetical protein
MRTDLFESRRRLAEAWAKFCAGGRRLSLKLANADLTEASFGALPRYRLGVRGRRCPALKR